MATLNALEIPFRGLSSSWARIPGGGEALNGG